MGEGKGKGASLILGGGSVCHMLSLESPVCPRPNHLALVSKL